MELKLNIGYQELLALVQQLPTHIKRQLQTDISNEPENNPVDSNEGLATVIKKMRVSPMFEAIENPIAYQKQLRDEWE